MIDMRNEIDWLKTQLKNLEQSYAEVKEERNGLLAANTAMDRERNIYRDQAKTYRNRTELARSVANSYFVFNRDDPELTIKAMQRALIGTVNHD